MSKWTKKYPIDFTPHGDSQGSAVQKQDQEFDNIYEKLNKVFEKRSSDYISHADDLVEGEVIVKNNYKLTIQKNSQQVIVNILKNDSVENDVNETVNALGLKKIGNIYGLDFRSNVLNGYIRIAELTNSPKANCIPVPDVSRRGTISISLDAANLLPSDVLPITRDYYNYDARPYPSYWRFRGIEERQNLNTIYYKAQNNEGIYIIRYFFNFEEPFELRFYIQAHQSDMSIYFTRNHWNNDNTKTIHYGNNACIFCSAGATIHSGEILYSPHQNIRTASIVGTNNQNNKWSAYMGGGRWRNTGSDVTPDLGYTWSSPKISHGIIIIEKVAW